MKTTLRAFILLLAGLVAVAAAAQNNPFKIDDGLYAGYLELFKQRRQPQCLPMCDSLCRQAMRMADYKALCVLLTIPVNYQFYASDSTALVRAVERLQQASRQYGYLQYYYFGYNNVINWLLLRGYTLRALQVSQQMRRQAEIDKHDYGFYSCLKMQGNIYIMRGDPDLGAACYLEAYEYQKKYLPDQDPAQVLRYLAQYYLHKRDYPMASKYVTAAIESAKTNEARLAAQMEQCRYYYALRDSVTFLRLYNEIEPKINEQGRTYDDLNCILQSYKCELLGDRPQALDWAGRVSNTDARFDLLIGHAQVRGDYKAAFDYSERFREYRDSMASQVSSSDMAEVTVQLANEAMQRQARELELRNTELQLANTRLELDHARNLAEMEKAQADNNLLSLRNSELELEHLNMEMERHSSLQREQASRARSRTMLLGISLAFTLVLAALMMLYIFRRRKMVGALQASNQELTVARDRAMESDRMKTLFIQNISHEIRTPLNAIVGFSQLLTDDEMELDTDDRRDYCSQISSNSDMLIMLVNDVLDLSQLESGRYTMQLAPSLCNAICRNALAAVQHRCPEGVELRFASDVPDNYELNTDAKRVKQVLINFLTNAEKNTQAGGVIRLRCAMDRAASEVTFEVTNTGQRIPPEKADAIFERFYKIDVHKQGTGLGLSICRLIAERLRGQVMCDSSYTQGARFLFTLPVE